MCLDGFRPTPKEALSTYIIRANTLHLLMDIQLGYGGAWMSEGILQCFLTALVILVAVWYWRRYRQQAVRLTYPGSGFVKDRAYFLRQEEASR